MMRFSPVKCFKEKGLVLLFLLLSLNVLAQDSEEFLKLREAYPNAQILRLKNETIVTLNINKGAIDIVQEVREEDLYMDESATRGSKRSVNFSAFFEMEKIEAATLIPNGKKYRERKVTNYTEKDELGKSFYDDTRSVNFIFPDLRKGGKTRLHYIEKIKNPRFLSPFYLGDFFPVINNKFTIVADKDINFNFRQFNMEGLDIKYSESEKRNNRIYTWELKDVKEYKSESNAPTYKKVIPHIIPVITSYKVNGSTIEVLNDVEDLFRWYNSLVSSLNKEEATAELVSLVEDLTRDKETDLKKVKAIYYWTQQNIKYIAFEYALGGFIPREANAVFQKKYGDCKDNSSILHQMLEVAGIKGHLTWIGTRDIPYTYEQVPTPLVDNHMILAYKDGGQTYFLDATGRYLPIDLPSSFIQEKEALIAMEDGNFIVEKVPVVAAESSVIRDSTSLKLEGENLRGMSKAEISGFQKVNFFNYLEDIKTQDRLKEFYKVQFEKGNNRFLIEDFSETNKYDYEKDLVVEYTFSIDNYAKILGNEIFFNLNLNKELSEYKIPIDRKNEIEYDFKTQYHFINSLEIPEGYEVDYLPVDQELENQFLSSKISYAVEGNKIVYQHFINLDFLILDLQAQKEVNSLIRDVEKAYKETIVLKRTQTSP
jgi:hypothetical protein